ncbi:MAG: hypothetical protein WA618_03600 [Terriglobales bacterium]
MKISILLFSLAVAASAQQVCLQLTGTKLTQFACPSASAAATWGSITGDITKQADLQAALLGKANAGTTGGGVQLSTLAPGTLAIGPLSDGTYFPVSFVAGTSTAAATFPTVPIQTLVASSPGALYWTPDQINAVVLCVAGTASPGCPGPAVAANVAAEPFVWAKFPINTLPGPYYPGTLFPQPGK